MRRRASNVRRAWGCALAGIVLAATLGAAAPAATAEAGNSSPSGPTDFVTAARTTYARAVLDIGVAYFATRLNVEPNLNGIQIARVPARPASGHPTVSRLVTHASRRELAPADALASHLDDAFGRIWPCGVGDVQPPSASVSDRCFSTPLLQVPSLERAPFGALELIAPARTASFPISPFDLLTAAFETGRWRPAGLHPMTAEAARQAAAEMRHRTSGLDRPCHVTALWVAVAVVADAPDIRLAGGGFWLDGDSVRHLGSQARHAARTGCVAAEALHGRAGAAGAGELDFWDPPTVLAISSRAGGGVARTLGNMTAGTMRPQGLPMLDESAVAIGDVQEPFRGCDAEIEVASASDIVRVRGFEVHECLAHDLRRLLAAARSDGIILGGWGWRSTAQQIDLRRLHCPLPSRSASDYWTQLSLLSPRLCNPPVARPATSLHEFGLAVDFTCGTQGAAITRTSRCFRWLAANAHSYGLYNLLFEPWHWSTTGR